ncbi:DoxX family protein [Candidatus Woesearchaeota archaeon]|nr:DoxX family protein [Candidatus Woesearchaeota archaeon]
MAYKYRREGITLLRITIGLFFIITGLMKLIDPAGIINLLSDLGFPISFFLGWLVLLSEIIFGFLVLIGWRPEISVWPLVIILLVALITVHIPSIFQTPMNIINVMFHILAIIVFISLSLTGPGKLAVTSRI